ncbi:right-handed parallel beta-helix repeat-containing protein [Leptolinea tardivitalis]|uniref:Right handed beta helix domain-containing protein n=1 Tax=Leptolinea tardivitalis TaxID=229920 RepID=A0A0P6WT53_9CHLR|nr:right-handed parallel beta-helix repeat-containing protein [Leptolinea tardivitalis]KPL73425.1 hypothetical protein ADM99_04305 [Leptolinea tardivitalis]GAP21582.1 right handed beta helix region [Leptolinea tardivitalis]
MGKKKWYVILFYVVFVCIYALGLSIPIGMVVLADDTAPADPASEEVAPEEPPPEQVPEDSPAEGSSGESSSSGTVYYEPAPVIQPPVVVEQPVQPPASVEQPPADVQQEPAAPVQPEVVVTEQPAALDPSAATTTESTAGSSEKQTGTDGQETGNAEPETGGAPVMASPVIQSGSVLPVDSFQPPINVEEVAELSTKSPVDLSAALPEGTSLVVLDETGENLALGSTEAEAVLTTGDPMWCPGHDAAGSASCHSETTLEAIIHYVQSSPSRGYGTIYVQDTYTSPTHNTINIDQGSHPMTILNLFIIGGVDLATGSSTYGQVIGTTTLAQNIYIDDISGSLSLSNFILQQFSTSGSSVYISDSNQVTLDNMAINNQGLGNGVHIENSNNVTIKNSTIDDEDGGHGIYAHSNTNNLQIINTHIYEYGYEGGIYLNDVDNVLLKDLIVDSNGNTPCVSGWPCSSDAIRVVNGSNLEVRNVNANSSSSGASGLVANGVSGYINIFNSTFDNNNNFGIDINSQTADVTIKNTSTSHNSNNGSSWGMYVEGAKTISLDGVHADHNVDGGAYLIASDWISILNSTFSDNPNFYGLAAWAMNQGITLSNVTVDNNNFGGWFKTATELSISKSQFNGNHDYGIHVEPGAVGDITLYKVTASENGTNGAELQTAGDITVTCSVFSANDSYGLNAGAGSTVTLNSNTFSANGSGSMNIWDGGVVTNMDYPCGTSSGGGDDDGGTTTVTPVEYIGVIPFVYLGPPAGVIPVTGGEFVMLSCTGNSTIRLPTGEETIFNQPMCGYIAGMELITQEELPAPIPEPWIFTDGFTLTLMFNNEVVLEAFAGATYTVTFPLTEEQINDTFHILFWDTTTNDNLGGWVDLGGEKEAMKWIRTHNRTGTFILVK